MTIFDSSLFSSQNAEIIFISVIGGAMGNAMYSYTTTEVAWLGEHRMELAAVSFAAIAGLVLWINKSKLQPALRGTRLTKQFVPVYR